jgi:hypothetical protein
MDRRMNDWKMDRMEDNKSVHNSSLFPLVGLQIKVCSSSSTSSKVLFISCREREETVSRYM